MPHNTFQSIHTKRISFILTTKNHESFLRKSLTGARALVKKPHDELIVIDGGSTDGTSGIIEEFRDLIDVFVSEPDLGIAHAINKGVLLARGEYIQHISDDDTFYPEAMERVVKIFEANKEVEFLVCGHRRRYWHSPDKVHYRYLPPGVNYGSRPEDAFQYKASGAGFIMRRRVFAKVGLMPLGIASDAAFAAQCIAHGGVTRFCRIILGEHNILPHSATPAKLKEASGNYYRAMRQYCSYSFYLRFRLKRFFRRQWWGWIGLALMRGGMMPVLLYRLLRREGIEGVRRNMSNFFKGNKIKNEPPQYMWDGGFS